MASRVVSPEDFLLNDPFMVLLDDHLDIATARWAGRTRTRDSKR
jgi:hypothetical protein